jgi:hypothetical protein
MSREEQKEGGRLMRGMILLGVLLVLAGGMATPVRGQAGQINLFVDSLYTYCLHYEEYGSYDVHVYVVHQNTPGATGCRFKLKASMSLSWFYWGETSPYAVTGNTQTGITVNYGACLASDILVTTVLYLKDSQSGRCATIRAVPDPAAPSGTIEVYDCSGNTLVGGSQPLVINPGGWDCWVWCSTIPVEESTWGRVKALYE